MARGPWGMNTRGARVTWDKWHMEHETHGAPRKYDTRACRTLGM